MDTKEKFIDMLGRFDNAMLVTHSQTHDLEARPMAVAQVDEGGGVWFVTDRQSGKMIDLAANRNVVVTMQSSNEFLTMVGRAEIHDNREKVHELWQTNWKVWFPEGKDDPSIVLLRIDPEQGEYWDNSGLSGIKYLFKTGKAYVKGERAETDPDINASVSLDQ